MSRKLSYADAVKLLGGESRVVAALDRLTGGLLLASTGVGGDFVLSLFDARSEMARLSRELVTGLSDRMRGLSRFDRTSRLSAAQSVLVITAYFEAVRDAPLPFDAGKLRLGRSESVRLATGRELDSARLPALARILNDSDLPRPMPRDGRDTLTTELRLFYTSLGEDGDHDEATTEFGQDSTAHALIRLWLLSGRPGTCEELSDAYRSCLSVVQLSRPPEETSSRDMYLTMVLRQLAADTDRVSEETLSLARGIFEETLMADGTASREQLAWFRQAFGER